MPISSLGIGSGLSAESIVTQLVALEKLPLQKLQVKASSINTKLSTFSQIKSLVSTMADAAAKLTRDSAWSGMAVSSSESTAVSASVTGLASATSFSMEVQQLARAQSISSVSVVKDAVVGTGSLSIQVGAWNTVAGASPPNSSTTDFLPGSAAAVNISIVAGKDTMTSIAAKINDSSAGVIATVLRDTSGERIMLRSKTTGETSGFKISATENPGGTGVGLSSLAFDLTKASGAAFVPAGMAVNNYQLAKNTKATINGVPVTSTTTAFAEVVPGLTIQASQVTTSPVEIGVKVDKDATKASIQSFVDAYNAVNTAVSSSTLYDADTKKSGVFQGDATTIGLQNALRGMVTSGMSSGVFKRLSDIGIDMQRGGKLSVSTSKLDTALNDPDSVKKMFASATGTVASEKGVAVKLKIFTDSLLAFSGTMNNKADALSAEFKRNSTEQERVNDRAAVVEKRLRKQYSALDVKVGGLTALGNYVNQQFGQTNRSN